MNEQKKTLIFQLEKLINDIGVNKVIIAKREPEVPMPREILPCPRIIIPLAGQKRVFCTSEQFPEQQILFPDDALFVPALYCTRALWDSDHEMISIVLHKDMLRILYINYHLDKENPVLQPVPDAFYHVKYYHETTSQMFKTLSAAHKCEQSYLRKLVECLLYFTLEDLIQSQSSESHARLSCTSWPWIIEYIHNNIGEDITREHVAKKFNLTPQYISRLFKKNTNLTFKSFMTAERMKRAADLLRSSNLTVDEISWECGFKYTSYFIRIFQQHYKKSPGAFRRFYLDNQPSQDTV